MLACCELTEIQRLLQTFVAVWQKLQGLGMEKGSFWKCTGTLGELSGKSKHSLLAALCSWLFLLQLEAAELKAAELKAGPSLSLRLIWISTTMEAALEASFSLGFKGFV